MLTTNRISGYIISQIVGGIIGAAVVYANYYHAIDIFENGERTLRTAGLFSTYAVCSVLILPFSRSEALQISLIT
jgi:glycerol uptake facilitator-like aquaporin